MGRGQEAHPRGARTAEPTQDTALLQGGLGGGPEVDLRAQTLSQAAPGIKASCATPDRCTSRSSLIKRYDNSTCLVGWCKD